MSKIYTFYMIDPDTESSSNKDILSYLKLGFLKKEDNLISLMLM